MLGMDWWPSPTARCPPQWTLCWFITPLNTLIPPKSSQIIEVMFSSAIPNWGTTLGIPHQVTWPWHCSAPRKMQQIFASARIDDDAMCEAMKRSVAEFGYLPCPHTAVALGRCVSRSWNGSWKILKDASERIQKRSSWYFSVHLHHPNFESVSGATASSWWFHGSAVSVLFT